MSYVTANGKELQITVAPNTALYKVSFTTGGELPSELQGLFTSVFEAERAILTYLGRRETVGKGRRNAANTANQAV